MSIIKYDSYEKDFDCRVNTLDELIEILQQIQKKHPKIKICTYESTAVSLYLSDKHEVVFS